MAEGKVSGNFGDADGRHRKDGTAVGRELRMDYVYTDLLPQDKLEQLEDFMSIQGEAEKLVCVGDGINDAPMLARADIGIAMGNLGSEAAIEAADVILVKDDLHGIVAFEEKLQKRHCAVFHRILHLQYL